MEKSNFKYLTKITCVIFLCLLMSCERSINNKKLCMTEVDTTGIDRDVMKYIHLYMDNHKAYNSFVLIETMMFYDRDSLGIFDEKQSSSIFDIMPAIDVFFGHGEYGLLENYPSSYILFEGGKKAVFIKSSFDDFFDKNQMKEIYEKYAYHVENLEALEIYEKEHHFFILNRNTGKVEEIDEHERYKFKPIIREISKFSPPN